MNPAGVVKKCHILEIRAVIFYLNWAFAFARQTVTRACSLFQKYPSRQLPVQSEQ